LEKDRYAEKLSIYSSIKASYSAFVIVVPVRDPLGLSVNGLILAANNVKCSPYNQEYKHKNVPCGEEKRGRVV
jgi:hypothetical protein